MVVSHRRQAPQREMDELQRVPAGAVRSPGGASWETPPDAVSNPREPGEGPETTVFYRTFYRTTMSPDGTDAREESIVRDHRANEEVTINTTNNTTVPAHSYKKHLCKKLSLRFKKK